MLKFIYTDMELTDYDGRITKSRTFAHLENETLLNLEKGYDGIKWDDFNYLQAKYPILNQFGVFGKRGKRKISDWDSPFLFPFAYERKINYIPVFLKVTYKEDKDCTLQDLMNEPIEKVLQYCKENNMNIINIK